jgi:hypothetical protein
MRVAIITWWEVQYDGGLPKISSPSKYGIRVVATSTPGS